MQLDTHYYGAYALYGVLVSRRRQRGHLPATMSAAHGKGEAHCTGTGCRAVVLAWALGLGIAAHAVEYSHGFSSLGSPKYPAGFDHFDYVEPGAPKAGVIRIAGYDSYDSFNSLIDKGISAAGLGGPGVDSLIYDRLLEPAIDEPASGYGRLADGVWVADDFRQVAFRLRPTAYWHDGTPLTADDVVFTFEVIRKHGSAAQRSLFARLASAERIGAREVLFSADPDSNASPDLAVIISLTPILPRHYWRTRDIARTTTEPPLGSGPYRVDKYDLGRNVAYVRVDDYWGSDLAVNKGRYNFARIVYDYFRDEYVMLEALKGDVIDIRQETLSKNWSTGYGFPAVKAGYFKKELVDLAGPRRPHYPLMWNLDKKKFRDIRIREALWLLYDYKWVNRVLNFGFYEYANSYFYNSPMAQRGLPSAAELKLLEPWRGQIPERVFTNEWPAREPNGEGYDREALKRALALFAAAGWELRDGVMVNLETGEPFTISFVNASPASKRTEDTFMTTLNRIGIRTTMRIPELSNWYYRVRTGKFDTTTLDFGPGSRPGQLLRMKFGSVSADEPWGLNWGNVRNPAVDAMIEHVSAARSPEELNAAARALDRILLWNFYTVPALVAPGFRLVYWDRFGRPQNAPRLHRVAWLDTWWWDSAKAASVDAGMAALTGKRR